MKKLIALILTAVLCLTACSALAETTLNKIAEINDARWLYGSDLLRVEGQNGYALARPDGTILTAYAYTSDFDYNYGWVTAQKSNQGEGIVSKDGVEVTPFQYGDIKVLNKNWAACFNLTSATADNYDYRSYSNDNTYYLIYSVDFYWLPEGRLVGTLFRSNYNGCHAYDEVLNIEDRSNGTVTSYDNQFNALGTVRSTYDDDYARHYSTFRSNGQQGLMDPDGNVVMQPSFQYIDSDVRDGYFTVNTGEKYGLADLNGNVVVPAEYDRIKACYNAPDFADNPYVVHGYVCVEKNNKLGYYSLANGETCPPKYASTNLDNNGVSALFTDMAGNVNILAADGTETMIEGYDRISAISYTGGVYYETRNADYDSGMIDWHGVEILPTEYESLDVSGSGRYLLTQKTYRDPCVIWEISCNDFDTVAAAPASDPVTVPAPDNGGQASTSPVALIIDQAIQMIGTSPDLAATLLDSAAMMLADNLQAQTIVTTAATLLRGDAAANAATVTTLLDTVKGIL